MKHITIEEALNTAQRIENITTKLDALRAQPWPAVRLEYYGLLNDYRASFRGYRDLGQYVKYAQHAIKADGGDA